jgi:hypothetical protein
VLPLVLVGVAGGVVAVSAREGNPAFVYRQQHAVSIEASEVVAAVKTAHEPVPGGNGSSAIMAKCTPGSTGPRRNPWHCRVRYASGHVVGYDLVIAPDGSWRGQSRTGLRRVVGCCFHVGE